MLKKSLEEEKASDEKLTIVAVSAINIEASETKA
jgi:ferritin-like metal-binding protein YciE